MHENLPHPSHLCVVIPDAQQACACTGELRARMHALKQHAKVNAIGATWLFKQGTGITLSWILFSFTHLYPVPVWTCLTTLADTNYLLDHATPGWPLLLTWITHSTILLASTTCPGLNIPHMPACPEHTSCPCCLYGLLFNLLCCSPDLIPHLHVQDVTTIQNWIGQSASLTYT